MKTDAKFFFKQEDVSCKKSDLKILCLRRCCTSMGISFSVAFLSVTVSDYYEVICMLRDRLAEV